MNGGTSSHGNPKPKKRQVSIVRSSAAEYLTFVAAGGKNYNTLHYKLPAIIAVGYKVNSERAVQFRKWATKRFAEVIVNRADADKQHMGLTSWKPV